MPTSRRASDPAEEAPDPLRQLTERLDRASLQARRLAVEAAEAALRGGPVPPSSGWAAATGEKGSDAALEAVLAALHSVRDLIPPELARRLAEAVRELLLAIRALLDWYIERLDRGQTPPDEAQDIPIL